MHVLVNAGSVLPVRMELIVCAVMGSWVSRKRKGTNHTWPKISTTVLCLAQYSRLFMQGEQTARHAQILVGDIPSSLGMNRDALPVGFLWQVVRLFYAICNTV